MFVAAGLVGAGFLYLRQTEIPRAFASFEDPSNPVRTRAFWKLDSRFPLESLTDSVLAIESAPCRGAFHRVLAETGDPSHVEAIFAFVRDFDSIYSKPFSSVASRLEFALPSLMALDREKTRIGVSSLWPLGPASMYDNENLHDTITEALTANFDRSEIIEWVLTIENDAERGRFHAALATTGDPAQVPAILARIVVQTRASEVGYRAPARAPYDPPYDPERDHRAEVVSIFSLSRPPRAELAAGLGSESKMIVGVCAEVLREVDLELLLKVTHERLDEYDREYPRLALAKWATNQNTRDRVGDLEGLGLTLNEARSLVRDADREARMLGELLRSLHRLPVSRDVDFVMIRGLSSLTPSVAEFCANALDERLDTSDLVDAMFSYIAAKSEFMVREVDVYENILRRQGLPGADGIAANLERLIDDEGGSPDNVFWIYKKMGFTLLGELGAVEHKAVLERYLPDTTSYIRSNTRGEVTNIQFTDACAGALARMKLRASGDL